MTPQRHPSSRARLVLGLSVLLPLCGCQEEKVAPAPPAAATAAPQATGSAAGFALGVEATSPRGTLVLKSTLAEMGSINLAPVVINEIQVLGSRCGPFPPAIRALEADDIDVRGMISDRVPLSRADEALQRAAEAGVIKVLIEP